MCHLVVVLVELIENSENPLVWTITNGKFNHFILETESSQLPINYFNCLAPTEMKFFLSRDAGKKVKIP